MKIIFAFYVSIILFSCHQQPLSEVTETKKFLTQLGELHHQEPNRPNGSRLLIDTIIKANKNILEVAKTEPLFSRDDLYYIRSQMVHDQDLKWTNGIVSNVKIVSRHYIDSLAKPDPFTKTPAYIELSKPFFSLNKQYCIIYLHVYCGNLCAEWSTSLYKKNNGKWTFVKSYYSMVS